MNPGPILFVVTLSLWLGTMASVCPSKEQTNPSSKESSQGNKYVRRLDSSEPIERTLASGEEHDYEVELARNWYLKVIVDQLGIDVLVTVIDPDGKQLVKVDKSRGIGGQETINLVATKSGLYRLNLRLFEKHAAAGRYQIRVTEVRTATESDRILPEQIESPLKTREDQTDDRLLLRLGLMYCERGIYERAEPLFQQALRIREKELGPEDPRVADALRGLAWLYYLKQEYDQAEPLNQRALTIYEKAFGSEDLAVAASVNRLGMLYYAKGQYDKAEPAYHQALTIREKRLGRDHIAVAQSLNNLGVLYHAKGDYDKAEPFYLRSLKIRENVAPSKAETQKPYQSTGRPGDELREASLQASAKAKITYSTNREIAQSLNNLAVLYQAKREIAKAITFQARANEVSDFDLQDKLRFGSDAEKQIYLAALSPELDITVSLSAQLAPDNQAAHRLALLTVLRRKGRALDAVLTNIGNLRDKNGQPPLLLAQLANARSRLATLMLRGRDTLTLEQYQAEIKSLEEQVNKMERELSARSIKEQRDQHVADLVKANGTGVLYSPERSEVEAFWRRKVTLESIQAKIPPRAALVEYVLYRPFNARYTKQDEPFGALHYAVYVLENRGEPKLVDLGEAEPIDSMVAAFRIALRDPSHSEVKTVGRKLDEKLMYPIRRLLGETPKVLISPDGLLNLIPFSALVDEQNRYLVEQYSFTYLTSGSELLRLGKKTTSNGAAAIIADPDFGEAPSADSTRGAKVSTSSTEAVDFSQVYFRPLPGTAGEAQALKQIFPDATVLTKGQATETAIKQLEGYKIVHIATHGFFLEDLVVDSPAQARGLVHSSTGDSVVTATRVQNPLLRSGLALAGANMHRSGNDDGILTALEVAGLNLRGTRLVVLSACDTGVGEIKNGEGVYGLRRALAVAGSESQMMTLWPVADEPTRDLMIDYYKKLQVGAGRGDALRQAQLHMLANKSQEHPYYWASFIQAGEWANLDGKR